MTTCPACGTENRSGRKFCADCGVVLKITCATCGTANEPGEKFCGECGASLISPSASATSSSPATLAVAGEKKHITVLFADVAGSMDLQERLDSEVWAQIMSRFVGILAEGVRRFGGTVDKFTGDGIMALFGAPVAQEDHARRACHAAWHLTRAIGEWSEELRTEQGVELHVRLGLNSGEVVVGRVGDDVTLDPTALGHTVGLAQRMEAMAEPGTVYLTQHTARLVEGWFRLEQLGARSVKGATDPLRVFILAGPLSSPMRRTVGAAPLVGRDRELAVLEEALAMAEKGQFQVVGIVGEAGMGKSRLCDEFARRAKNRGIAVRRTAGVSHGRDVPLLPILAFQRDYFGIADTDEPSTARRKVTDRLVDLDPDLQDALPVLFDFLEIPDPANVLPAMAPEVRMRRLLDVVRRITARRSEREALVLIFEDLHWFDPQSDSFLKRLIESYPGSRTLIVTNFRPEFSARWMRHSYYRQLAIQPLHDAAVGELLGGLLGPHASLAPLLRFVEERTAGNPFFIEELVRVLAEDGTLAGQAGAYRLTRPLHEVKAPPSVHAVLAARIDRLPAEEKRVLQTAAALGRTFDAALLARVTGSADEVLEGALSALCSAELIHQVADNRPVEYQFWHPLTQEVAYGTLLSDSRRRLHAAVAEALVARNPDRLDELAAVMAWHWERAGEELHAAGWMTRAGEWALRSDVGEARRRWYRAIELVGGDDTEEALDIGVRARMRLVQTGARTGTDPAEADHLYAEGKCLAERLGNIRLLAITELLHGTVALYGGEPAEALKRWLATVHLASATVDRELDAAVSVGPLAALIFLGPVPEATAWYERIISLCAGDPDVGAELLGYSALAMANALHAGLVAQRGDLPKAAQEVNRAIRLARVRSDPVPLVWALTAPSLLAFLRGEPDGALSYAEEAVAISEETGNAGELVVALRAVALTNLAVDDAEAAATACERALSEIEARPSGLFELANVHACLAQTRLRLGDLNRAIASADEAVGVAQAQSAKLTEVFGRLTRGTVRRSTGDREAAAADLVVALKLASETGAAAYEPFIREELGRLHNDETEFLDALRLYRQIGATGHVRRLEAELSMKATR